MRRSQMAHLLQQHASAAVHTHRRQPQAAVATMPGGGAARAAGALAVRPSPVTQPGFYRGAYHLPMEVRSLDRCRGAGLPDLVV